MEQQETNYLSLKFPKIGSLLIIFLLMLGGLFVLMQSHEDKKAFAQAPPPAPQCAARQCADGQDNDTDGKTDFPADPGCATLQDNVETDSTTPPTAQCTTNPDNCGPALACTNGICLAPPVPPVVPPAGPPPAPGTCPASTTLIAGTSAGELNCGTAPGAPCPAGFDTTGPWNNGGSVCHYPPSQNVPPPAPPTTCAAPNAACTPAGGCCDATQSCTNGICQAPPQNAPPAAPPAVCAADRAACTPQAGCCTPGYACNQGFCDDPIANGGLGHVIDYEEGAIIYNKVAGFDGQPGISIDDLTRGKASNNTRVKTFADWLLPRFKRVDGYGPGGKETGVVILEELRDFILTTQP